MRRRITWVARGIAIIAPLATASAARADVLVGIVSPAGGVQLGAGLYVRATAASTADIIAVTAAVDGRQSDLQFNPDFQVFAWEGVVPLSGLAFGGKTLVVTARDADGTTGDASRGFTYDDYPAFETVQPVDGSVARPTLAIDVRSRHPLPCTIEVRERESGILLASGIDSLRADVDLGAWVNRRGASSLQLNVTSRDGYLSSHRFVFVYVDTTSVLMPLETAPGLVLDLDAARMLTASGPTFAPLNPEVFAGWSQSAVYDRAIHAASTVPLPGIVFRGYLTPLGAIYEGCGIDCRPAAIEWNGDVVALQNLARGSLHVAGPWAAWIDSLRVVRHYIPSGAHSFVAPTLSDAGVDISADGSLAWVSLAGVVTVGAAPRGAGRAPLVDGSRVVYRKGSTSPYGIAYHDGTSEHIVSGGWHSTPTPTLHYRVANGWLAFAWPASASYPNAVSTRSPDGTTRLVGTSSTEVRLWGLGPNGDVVFSSSNASGTTYSFTSGEGVLRRAIPYDFSYGRFVWLDDTWRYVLGNTLFALREPLTPIALAAFAAQASPEGVHLAWQLGRGTMDGGDAILVQRAAWPPGPYEDRSRALAAALEMGFFDPGAIDRDVWYRLVVVGPGRGGSPLGTIHVSAFTDFAPTRLERPRPSADGRGVVFEYVLGEPTARVQLAVYDVRGRLMFQTDPEWQTAGTFTVAWRGESRAGAAAARGVYMVRLRTASALRSHKFAYLRP